MSDLRAKGWIEKENGYWLDPIGGKLWKGSAASNIQKSRDGQLASSEQIKAYYDSLTDEVKEIEALAAPAREPQCPYVTYFSGGAYASCILDAGHGGEHKNHSFYNVSANAVWELEREKEISERPGLLATMESLRARVSQLEQELAHTRQELHDAQTELVNHDQRDALREALEELVDLMDKPDPFTCQPARAALAQGKDKQK